MSSTGLHVSLGGVVTMGAAEVWCTPPQLEALRETSLARGSSTKEATVLALSLRASSIRPWGVSGSGKPLMVFSGKILMEYSPVV